MSDQSRSEHILVLAKELLDDIELSRSSAEALLLKTSRLARWVGSDEIKVWIKYEMQGYNSSDEISLKYMGVTGRWTKKNDNKGYWGPLAQHEAAIEAEMIKLKALRVPDTAGDMAYGVMRKVTDEMKITTNYISKLSGIRSRVLARLHEFVSEVYYEKEFDSLSESIFERYKKDVDTLIVANCGDVLEQIPSVMDRLSVGNSEAVSQALTTCRRIIEAFSDSIFPPSDDTIKMNGNDVTLGANKHQNRINAFVFQKIQSKSRRVKIRQNLSNLYDRISTGVHNDVSAEEANSLFLNTYLLLGEVLHIGKTET